MPKQRKYDHLKNLLTVQTVASRLRISERTVLWQITHGHIPGAHKIGTGKRGIWLIPPSALKKYVPPTRGRPVNKSRGKK